MHIVLPMAKDPGFIITALEQTTEIDSWSLLIRNMKKFNDLNFFFSLVPGYVLFFLWFPDIRISLGIPSGSFQHQVSILSLGRIHIVVRQNILMFCNIPAFQLSFQVSSVYLFVIYNPNIPY